MKQVFFFLLSFAFLYTALFAEEPKDDWKFFGEAQIRSELDGRDFNNSTYPPSVSNMRLRFAVQKSIMSDVTFYLQMQDSRTWGQEGSTTESIKNIDLHQGWAMVSNIFNVPLSVQVGRFEKSYGSQRFFGPNNWNYIGRSWDGTNIKYDFGPTGWIEGFVVIANKFMDYVKQPTPSAYSVTNTPDVSSHVYGFWSDWKLTKEHTLDVFAYYEQEGKESNGKDDSVKTMTFGLNYDLKFGDFNAFAEFAYQTGKKYQSSIMKDVAAYAAAIKLKYSFDDFWLAGNFDMESGTKHNEYEKINAFARNWGTNHKLYGYMDYFTKQSNVNNRGINDIYLEAMYAPKSSPFSASLNFHYFTTNVKDLQFDKEMNQLGEEIDLVLKYNIAKNVSVEWGNGLFLPGELMKEYWRLSSTELREDPAFWTYVMLSLKI